MNIQSKQSLEAWTRHESFWRKIRFRSCGFWSPWNCLVDKLRVSLNKIQISQWTEILLPKLTIYIIVDWTLGSPLSLISCLPRRIVAFPLFWIKPSLLVQKLTFLRTTINLRLSFPSLLFSYSLKLQWINPYLFAFLRLTRCVIHTCAHPRQGSEAICFCPRTSLT